MKILLFGDVHFTDKKPKNRKDENYFGTILEKFTKGLIIGRENRCDVTILPGDLFDSFKASHHVVQQVIRCLRMFPYTKFLAVAGQHDMVYHSNDLANTPIKTLVDAGFITILGSKPVNENLDFFYGAGYGEEIPDIQTPEMYNILVTHRMIVEEKLWDGQEEFDRANHILTRNKFNLICSGDNHQLFTATTGGRHLINLGSMVRTNISQYNHKPSVAVIDTTTNTFEIFPLTVKPFDDVMDTSVARKEEERSKELDCFIASLKQDEITGLDFVTALHDYAIKNQVEDSVYEIIKGALK